MKISEEQRRQALNSAERIRSEAWAIHEHIRNVHPEARELASQIGDLVGQIEVIVENQPGEGS